MNDPLAYTGTIHEFTVRTPDGRIDNLVLTASTRAVAAAWIDRSDYTIVARIGR